MKNLFRLLGVIAMVVVIGFFITACSDSGGSSNNGDGDDIKVDIVGATLRLYDKEVTYIDQTTITSFGNLLSSTVDGPISDYITGTPKVEINNSKLTIELDQPKPENMLIFSGDDIYGIDMGITATPADAKCFNIGGFYEEDTWYILQYFYNDTVSGMRWNVRLIYMEKDVILNGTIDVAGTYWTYDNVSLKQGWNYLIWSYDNTTNTFTYTATRTEPSSIYKWYVYH